MRYVAGDRKRVPEVGFLAFISGFRLTSSAAQRSGFLHVRRLVVDMANVPTVSVLACGAASGQQGGRPDSRGLIIRFFAVLRQLHLFEFIFTGCWHLMPCVSDRQFKCRI